MWRWPTFTSKQKLSSLWYIRIWNKFHVNCYWLDIKAEIIVMCIYSKLSVLIFIFTYSYLYLIDDRCLSPGLLPSTLGSATSAEQRACWSCVFLFACLILCGQLVSSCQWISYATCLAPVNGPLSDLDVSVLLRYLNVSTLYNNVSEGVSLLFKLYDPREKEKHLFWWLLWGGCLVEDGDQPDIVESLWGTKACLHQSWQLVGMVMTA